MEAQLIERILVILGTPLGRERLLDPEDVEALRHCARVLDEGFPLVAFLQLVRVYVQSLRRIADAEVRLFHLYVHEPMIRDAVPELEMAEEIGGLAGNILPLAAPITEYLHTRYLRYFLEQDVVGHMESELGVSGSQVHHVPVTLCFIDLTGFTRYTEEEGDLEALDVIENFVGAVEETLPPEATLVKTIGDEVMVVSPDPGSLTEWAVDLLSRLPERPQPRVGIHYAQAVYRDGDYFGTHVNLAHRVVGRALAGEVLVTDTVAEALRERPLACEAIGDVTLKGFPEPTPLFVVRSAA
jgi:adenylate cyclase